MVRRQIFVKNNRSSIDKSLASQSPHTSKTPKAPIQTKPEIDAKTLRVRSISGEISKIDTKIQQLTAEEKEINEQLKLLPSGRDFRGQRNRLFNRADSINAQRQSLLRDRTKQTRKLRLAKGQKVGNRQKKAKREGRPFSTEQTRRNKILGINKDGSFKEGGQ